MKKFNHQIPFNLELKRDIEAFFDYKWTHDKNMAFKEEQDKSIFEQLPEQV